MTKPLPTISELVKDTTSHFNCYRDGDLWYNVVRATGDYVYEDRSYYPTYETIFEFPIPISDTGTGIFEAQHKSVNLMRWIRKHLEKKAKGEA